jgi:hypothetical protein
LSHKPSASPYKKFCYSKSLFYFANVKNHKVVINTRLSNRLQQKNVAFVNKGPLPQPANHSTKVYRTCFPARFLLQYRTVYIEFPKGYPTARNERSCKGEKKLKKAILILRCLLFAVSSGAEIITVDDDG